MDRVYTYWKDNPHLWFNSTSDDDERIYNEFINLLKNQYIIENMNVQEWTSYVILYDQLVKHFNRHMKINHEMPLNFIENCIVQYNKFKNSLSDFEFMFMLMPLRHTHMLSYVKYVLTETWWRLEQDPLNIQIKKYLIATYERYIKCTPLYDNDNIKMYIKSNVIFNSFDILDLKCMPYQFTNLINSEHLLVKHMKDFIKTHNLHNKLITVSISGGVDSMVCCYLLKMCKHPFIALHINYMNRAECLQEEELLKWWCNTVMDIPLHIRRIDEINRPKCMEFEMRELYESYTKDIRFRAYYTTSPNPIIMLGHNKDDTIENILTNMASASHYDNLCGMTDYSSQKFLNGSLCFIRPLLQIMKSDIYTFATEHNIPYLVDSTPKWSQRGKIRDIVRPALEEWNPLIIDGMMKLSEQLKQMTCLLDRLISTDINFDNINDVPLESIYWSKILKKHNIIITQKTMSCLIEKIKFLQKNPYKLTELQKFTLCKHNYIEFIQKDKLYITISFI